MNRIEKILFTPRIVAVLCISCILVLTIFALNPDTVVIDNSGLIRTLRPLHTEGRYIMDDLGNVVILKGVNKHGFEDDPRGHWIGKDGIVRWSTFDPQIVCENLDAMKSWGCNVLRVYSTVEFWMTNASGHRKIIKDLAELCANRGMYVILSWWHILENASQTSLPYPPYCESNPYINDAEDFVNFWEDVAAELKDYINIIFELWNEPGMGYSTNETVRNEWLIVAQNCIDGIRSTGATNLVVVQWGYGLFCDLQTGSKKDLSWIEAVPLNGINIVYSTHYFDGVMLNSTEIAYEYEDIKTGLNICLVNYTLTELQKPLLIGEIGANMWKTGDALTKELMMFNNTLTIFNEYGISFCAFWWWSMGTQWALLLTGPNFQPNAAGIILQSKL